MRKLIALIFAFWFVAFAVYSIGLYWFLNEVLKIAERLIHAA